MPTVRHRIVLEAVPRRWLEDAVAAVHDLVGATRSVDGVVHFEEHPLPGVRHVAGRHLTAGARYEVVDDGETAPGLSDDNGTGSGTGGAADGPEAVETYAVAEDGAVAATGPQYTPTSRYLAQVVIGEWSRHAPTRIRLTGVTEEPLPGPDGTTAPDRTPQPHDATGEFVLDSAQRPRTLRAHFAYRGTGRFARYRRGDFRGKLDLTRLWAGKGPAPLALGIRHPLLQATLHASVRTAGDGRWQVTVTANWRGRGWFRPVQAVGAFLYRARIRAAFTEGAEEFAKAWNEEVPEVLAEDPRLLPTLLHAELTKADTDPAAKPDPTTPT